jgi:hypothetical protein
MRIDGKEFFLRESLVGTQERNSKFNNFGSRKAF